MNITVLDAFALNPGDLDLAALHALGNVTLYDRTPPDAIIDRAQYATAILTNKTPLTAATLAALPALRYIGVLATGHNVVDGKAARARNIDVTNIPTYGTQSVAQFTIGLLLELCHRIGLHNDLVHAGAWQANPDWSFHRTPQRELARLTFGVIGYGRIGQQTARVAEALGMQTLAWSPSRSQHTLEDVLRRSDVVSLHCPLTADNHHLINAERLALMRPGSFLLNTARGPLVDEAALAHALQHGPLAGAALDVLAVEPPQTPSPLAGLPNCILTPHIAWAALAARRRLLSTAIDNLRAWQQGHAVNVVNSSL
jgi:glycerate dehydrogenase